MAATHLTFDDAKVGMRVQDYWGCCGTLRWMGKLEKDNSPNKETGKFFGIEYDDESDNPLRSNGTWNGRKYFECGPRKGRLVKVGQVYAEINTERVAMLRERFGERVATWHDFELVKFCIARQFDMEKVYEMLERHLQWRGRFQPCVDEYFPQTIREDYPCGYTGTTDYDENLIYCERPGNAGHCQPSEFVRKYTLPVIARWHACAIEMGIARMRATNYRSKRVCCIVDLLNVKAMSRSMIGFAQTLATVEQDNYPENLGCVFIVNCPMFFCFAWKLLKIFIDERTNKKINFCAPNKAVEAMLPVMRKEDIPNFCGGTSNKWMETANGIIGSTNPKKVYRGEDYSPPSMKSEELNETQSRADSESPHRSLREGEAPTTTRFIAPDAVSLSFTPTSSSKSPEEPKMTSEAQSSSDTASGKKRKNGLPK
ncbi:sec14, cytosolic factor [Leishmania donovani]|uniref:CAP-Gly domain/CRAL/TRIO domain containing protein, putative n=1 Tax=Leishmania donovani TaxID=5661 RepID=A0A3S5H815_LEIDO|nr:sec14, cytosolic factor [Leishmania donovani]AYU83407.1 CAP-Gly domain/CRAL/TRIO domain containing protein, putative [Leishmania donovani]TPP48179.1 CRAL/TRIO domain family protein [Leishmania donovani]CBZ38502.1 sec14, cytosolic factor [Leishmania donovani]